MFGRGLPWPKNIITVLVVVEETETNIRCWVIRFTLTKNRTIWSRLYSIGPAKRNTYFGWGSKPFLRQPWLEVFLIWPFISEPSVKFGYFLLHCFLFQSLVPLPDLYYGSAQHCQSILSYCACAFTSLRTIHAATFHLLRKQSHPGWSKRVDSEAVPFLPSFSRARRSSPGHPLVQNYQAKLQTLYSSFRPRVPTDELIRNEKSKKRMPAKGRTLSRCKAVSNVAERVEWMPPPRDNTRR